MSKRFVIVIVAVIIAGSAIYLEQLDKGQPFSEAEAGKPFTEPEMVKRLAEMHARSGDTTVVPPAKLMPLDLLHPVRLAIGGLGVPDNDENGQLGDLVTVELTSAPGFQLVERRSLAAILHELNLNWSGFTRANDAVRVGKLLKADWFLLGTESKINGTNFIVARVVDARTGIVREAGVFLADEPSGLLAADLASFLKQSRQDAASAKLRVFLALGEFEDLSINDRQADFSRQLRGYLTAAFHGSGVTLLERDYVETLLQEVRLDLAGLTEGTSSHPPIAMQSAYWLVSGQYQSFETTNLQVEVNLDVQRAFGTSVHRTLCGLPGEPVERQVKAVIDDVMNQNCELVFPARAAEPRMQMNMGRELSGSPNGYSLVEVSEPWILDPQLAARKKRKLDDAIRAFETVLLLEPTNHEAKMRLAACNRSMLNIHPKEACNYYREIINDPVQDRWSEPAHQALVATFAWFGPDEKLRWLQSAYRETTNPVAREFYRTQLQAAQDQVTMSSGDSPKAEELAEKQLFDFFQSFKSFVQGRGGRGSDDMGMDDYIGVRKWDQATAAAKLAEMLPKMEKQAPGLEPYLLATVLTYQVNTNTPLTAEFQQTLKQCIEHPKEILAPQQFWDKIRWGIYEWCFAKTNFPLAVQLMEGERRAGAEGYVDYDDQEEIKLAYAYLAVERWQDALEIFQTFSNRPVQATGGGPWGRAFQPILTDKLAMRCRSKLGFAAAQDSGKFDLGKPVLRLGPGSTFAADDAGVWVGLDGLLLHLDFDLHTNLTVKLPIDKSAPITALCLAPSMVWIATAGAGLVEFDKSTSQCHAFTESDGLLFNAICSLCLADNVLWIGYGYEDPPGYATELHAGGGISALDLSSRRFTTFTSSFKGGSGIANVDNFQESADQPTRHAVFSIIPGSAGDIWFLAKGNVLRSFQPRNNLWKGFAGVDAGRCLASDNEHLFVGEYYPIFSGAKAGPLGLETLNFRDGQWQSFPRVENIPDHSVSALAVDGRFVWAGGLGYIARLDTSQNQTTRIATIAAQSVDKLQVAGGCLWAQFNGNLYRVVLSSVQ